MVHPTATDCAFLYNSYKCSKDDGEYCFVEPPHILIARLPLLPPLDNMFDSWFDLDVLVVATVLLLLYHTYKSARRGRLPPGPKGWPIVGNLDLPPTYFWVAHDHLRQQYGMSNSCSQSD